MVNDILPMQNTLAERHEIYYTPLGKVSSIVVKTENNITISVPSVLQIKILIYIGSVDVSNVTLISNINLN